jgi:hypothetical protein
MTVSGSSSDSRGSYAPRNDEDGIEDVQEKDVFKTTETQTTEEPCVDSSPSTSVHVERAELLFVELDNELVADCKFQRRIKIQFPATMPN